MPYFNIHPFNFEREEQQDQGDVFRVDFNGYLSIIPDI